MADIMVAFPGASTREVESAIATPAEQVMSEIQGVEHVYSVSRQGQAVITVQFEVGVPRQEALARQIADGMTAVDGLVDIDTILEAPTREWEVVVDRDRAARLGLSQAQVVSALQTSLGGTSVSFLHDDHAKYPVPLRVILGEGDKAQPSVLLSLNVRSRSGNLVPLASISEVREANSGWGRSTTRICCR